jgi:hypothetical protein
LPPLNVLAEDELIFIVAVLGVIVKPVVVAQFQEVPEPVIVIILDLKVIVLVVVPETLNNPVVKLLLLVSKVPWVTVKVLVEPKVKASFNVKLAPDALNVTGKSSVTPFDVIVAETKKVTIPVPPVTLIPVDMTKLPYMFSAALLLNQVPVNPVKSSILTELVDAKVTLSEPAIT